MPSSLPLSGFGFVSGCSSSSSAAGSRSVWHTIRTGSRYIYMQLLLLLPVAGLYFAVSASLHDL